MIGAVSLISWTCTFSNWSSSPNEDSYTLQARSDAVDGLPLVLLLPTTLSSGRVTILFVVLRIC